MLPSQREKHTWNSSYSDPELTVLEKILTQGACKVSWSGWIFASLQDALYSFLASGHVAVLAPNLSPLLLCPKELR